MAACEFQALTSPSPTELFSFFAHIHYTSYDSLNIFTDRRIFINKEENAYNLHSNNFEQINSKIIFTINAKSPKIFAFINEFVGIFASKSFPEKFCDIFVYLGTNKMLLFVFNFTFAYLLF